MSGSGHGWSGAWNVYWNSRSSERDNAYHRTARIKVVAAPTTLSWAVGAVGTADVGHNGRAVWEAYGRPAEPASLYLAQRDAARGSAAPTASGAPSPRASARPSAGPSVSVAPTDLPTARPSAHPSAVPEGPTLYTYEVPVCVRQMERRYPNAPFVKDSSCHNGWKILGSSGSAGSCTRKMRNLLIGFALPQLEADSVTAVELRVTMQKTSGNGLSTTLHGLPAEAPVHGKYPLAPGDYYGGIPDPESRLVPIAEEFAPTGLAAGATVSLDSAALVDYVKDQLNVVGGPLYGALSLATRVDFGCETSCGNACSIRRYMLKRSDVSLTITSTSPAKFFPSLEES